MRVGFGQKKCFSSSYFLLIFLIGKSDDILTYLCNDNLGSKTTSLFLCLCTKKQDARHDIADVQIGKRFFVRFD